MSVFIGQAMAGLSVAAVLFLAAAGLNLIWGVLRIMNFATGSIYMLGAYITLTLLKSIGSSTPAFVFALIAVPILCGLAGGLVERILLRRTYARSDEDQQFMLTLALSYVATGVVVLVWGTNFRTLDPPQLLTGAWKLDQVFVPKYTVFTILVGILVALLMWMMLYRTRLGLLTRAAASDRQMLSVLGVNVDVIYTLTFGLGVALGALGGALVSPVNAITTHLDLDILVPAFIVVVAGGLGRMEGALIAALVIGLLESFTALYFTSLVPVVPYVVLAIALGLAPLRSEGTLRMWIARSS